VNKRIIGASYGIAISLVITHAFYRQSVTVHIESAKARAGAALSRSIKDLCKSSAFRKTERGKFEAKI